MKDSLPKFYGMKAHTSEQVRVLDSADITMTEGSVQLNAVDSVETVETIRLQERNSKQGRNNKQAKTTERGGGKISPVAVSVGIISPNQEDDEPGITSGEIL